MVVGMGSPQNLGMIGSGRMTAGSAVEFTAARDRFLRATEADSLFALAYYRLSVTGGWLADTAIYVHAAERAVEGLAAELRGLGFVLKSRSSALVATV